ncbi:hypothetical protein H8356DRAFT_1362365 [Neocallimastix lanati (nom. inval.)]|nr:hypothetical protein H8356DRAFT_1362365 [Neocallimastix sp. JGI-2020a]
MVDHIQTVFNKIDSNQRKAFNSSTPSFLKGIFKCENDRENNQNSTFSLKRHERKLGHSKGKSQNNIIEVLTYMIEKQKNLQNAYKCSNHKYSQNGYVIVKLDVCDNPMTITKISKIVHLDLFQAFYLVNASNKLMILRPNLSLFNTKQISPTARFRQIFMISLLISSLFSYLIHTSLYNFLSNILSIPWFPNFLPIFQSTLQQHQQCTKDILLLSTSLKPTGIYDNKKYLYMFEFLNVQNNSTLLLYKSNRQKPFYEHFNNSEI